MTTTIGSYFMTLTSGETINTAYYPTDGAGAVGTGSHSSASHMKDAIKWVLTGLQVMAVGSTATRTWTLKDSSGTTIQDFDIPTSMNIGDTIDLGFRFEISGGFTIETDNLDCLPTVSYQIIQYASSVQ